MKKIILFILLFSFLNNVDAFENELLSIDIPDGYTEEINENNSYKWVKDNSYISVTFSDNSTLKYDIAKFNSEDIEKQKNYIQNNINDSIKDYNFEIEVKDINKIKFNNSYILQYDIFWPTKEITGFDTYQIGNVFTTKKYIVTFYYSCSNEINNEEYNNIIKSIQIKDEYNSNSYFNIFVFVVCICFCLFAIIKVFLDYKKGK